MATRGESANIQAASIPSGFRDKYALQNQVALNDKLSRASSKYSLPHRVKEADSSQYKAYFVDNSRIGHNLHDRYLKQLKKSKDLQEKGKLLKQVIKNRGEAIIESIVADRRRMEE